MRFAVHSRRAMIRARRLLRRRTSAPFLSGDAFLEICDYFVTPNGAISPRKASTINMMRHETKSSGRLLFCPSHLLSTVTAKLVHLPFEFVLVCGNSDHNFFEPPLLPENCRHAFLQNYTGLPTAGISRLPLGIENASLGRYPFRRYLSPSRAAQRKEMAVLLPPMSPTNPVRAPIRQAAKRHPTVIKVVDDYLLERPYFQLVSRYRFVLSLPGNGVEDHRIWETFYLNAYPVVIRSSFTPIFAELNLPALIVEDISQLSLDLLESHARMYPDPRNCEALWMPYWRHRLLQKAC